MDTSCSNSLKPSRRKIAEQIARISLPAVVTNISVPLLSIVDTAIVGHMGAQKYIGAVAVGGVVVPQDAAEDGDAERAYLQLAGGPVEQRLTLVLEYAEAGRFPGSFSSMVRIAAESASGTSRFRSEGGTGSSERCLR